MFFILIIINLIFIYFFYKIGFLRGAYLVGFLLSIFFVLSFFTSEGKNDWKQFIKNFFLTYISYINFVILALGAFFIFKYLYFTYYAPNDLLSSILSALTILTFICTTYLVFVFFDKKDYVKVTYFGITAIFIYLYFLLKKLSIFYYYISLMNVISIVGHLIYLLRFNKYNRLINYVNFITIITTLFIFMGEYIFESTIALSLSIQIFIALVLSYIIWVDKNYKKLIEIEKKLKEIEYEINLFGYSEIKIKKSEEEFYKTHKDKKNMYYIIREFFINAPTYIKVLSSLTNTIPILIATYSFFHQINTASKISNEILYWLGAIMYFVNFLLFKKLNWFVAIQRVFAFFVVNFVTYFTIIDFFGHNYVAIAIGGIIWNLIATVIMLYIGKKNGMLNVVDYLVWTIVNFLGVFINIYYLFKIGLNYYLSLGIVLLYLGFYLFLSRKIYTHFFYGDD